MGLQDGRIKLLNVSAGNLVHQIKFNSAFDHQSATKVSSNDPRARLAAFAAAKRREALKKLNPTSINEGDEKKAEKAEDITAICWGQQQSVVEDYSLYGKFGIEDILNIRPKSTQKYTLTSYQRTFSIGFHSEVGSSDAFLLLGAQQGPEIIKQSLNVLVAVNSQQQIQLKYLKMTKNSVNGVFQLAPFSISKDHKVLHIIKLLKESKIQ